MTAQAMALRHYEKEAIAQFYGDWSTIFPAEKALLKQFNERIAGKRVLDVGCGGGRTSAWLAAVAESYVGLDYAGRMVKLCRRRHPELAFVQGDATELGEFDANSFDFAIFSFNGIDTMSHDMRLKVFKAIKRVLRPNGWFAFSSHNRDYGDIVRSVDWRASLGPKSIRRNLKNLVSYVKVRHLEDIAADYAIMSDPRCGYCQLSYFISKRAQLRQLAANGFTNVNIIDWQGEPASADGRDRDSMAIYYMCQDASS